MALAQQIMHGYLSEVRFICITLKLSILMVCPFPWSQWTAWCIRIRALIFISITSDLTLHTQSNGNLQFGTLINIWLVKSKRGYLPIIRLQRLRERFFDGSRVRVTGAEISADLIFVCGLCRFSSWFLLSFHIFTCIIFLDERTTRTLEGPLYCWFELDLN